MTLGWILLGRQPVRAPDLETYHWANRLPVKHRRVAARKYRDPLGVVVSISTCFVGSTLQFDLETGEPLLFETLITGGSKDGWSCRTADWDSAEAAHQRGVVVAFAALNSKTVSPVSLAGVGDA